MSTENLMILLFLTGLVLGVAGTYDGRPRSDA